MPRLATHASYFVALPLAALVATGCAHATPAAPNSATPSAAVADGDAPPSIDEARSSFLVLSDRPATELEPMLDVAAVARAIGTKQCGDDETCRVVRAFAADSIRCKLHAIATKELGLTPDVVETIGRDLSPAQRARATGASRGIGVSCHGTARPQHLTARASYALAAVVAAKLDGIVVDPMAERLESAEPFAKRAIVTPLDAPAFAPRHIVIHQIRLDSGATRLVTLGMRRFGAPDIDTADLPGAVAAPLARVVSAVAARIAERGVTRFVPVTLADVARVMGEPAETLHIGAASPRPVTVELRVATRQEGDADNALVRLVPPGGTAPESYTAAAEAIFGAVDNVVMVQHDEELLAASRRAKARLPSVLERFERAKDPNAHLIVKLPFDIPNKAGSHEWMWIEVTSWDAVTIHGFLANEPESIPGLRSGMKVSGPRADVFDYVVKWADGRTEGGETNDILSRRAR